MDEALPANMRQGLSQEEIARRGWAYSAEEAKAVIGKSEVALIDLREERERTACWNDGSGSPVHAPAVGT